MRQRAVAAVLALTMLGFGGSGGPSAQAATGNPTDRASIRLAISGAVGVTYRAPVQPLRVLRGFDVVTSPYAAGHRGVDLTAPPDGAVRSAAAGTVSFAGRVANVGVVTVTHADGIRTTYEPLVPAVLIGQQVSVDDVLGTVSGTHGGSEPGTVLHWGARRGDVYIDPLALLRPLGVVRLLPW